MKKYIYIFLFFLLYSCNEDLITPSVKVLDNESISGSLIFQDSTYCCLPKTIGLLRIDTILQISDTLAITQSNNNHQYEFDSIMPEQLDLYIVMLTDEGLVNGQDNTPDGDLNETQFLFGNSIPVYLESNEDDTGNDFYFGGTTVSETKSVSGRAMIDIDGDGVTDIPAVDQRVELYFRSPDNVPQTPMVAWDNTGIDGSFSMDNIEAGEYILYYIGDGMLDATLILGYDDDQEPGEPASDNPAFIPVDLVTNESSDSLNYYILEQETSGCPLEVTIFPYWALCDTNTTCSLSEVPVIALDQNDNFLIQIDGYGLEWHNVTTGEMTNGDWIYVQQYQDLEVIVTAPNGCVYEANYYLSCEPQFEGELHLTNMMIGWDPFEYTYDFGEIVYGFNSISKKITISHNITSPVNNSILEEGVYDYYYEQTGLTYELKIDYNGLDISIGEISYDGDKIIMDDDFAADGIIRIFTKP